MKEDIEFDWLEKDEYNSLYGKDTSEEYEKLSQSQKEVEEKFRGWIFSSKPPEKVLVAKKGDEVLGVIEIEGKVYRLGLEISTRVIIKKFVLPSVYYLHLRREIAQILLTELLRKAEEHGAMSVESISINADDEDLLDVIIKMGFERTSVGYNLRKVFKDETLGYMSTLYTTGIKCRKCSSLRLNLVKREVVNRKEHMYERVEYTCLKCGETIAMLSKAIKND